MSRAVNDEGLDLLFRKARTHRQWRNEPVTAPTSIKSNFLCNLGYGDEAGLRPRAGRLEFDDACRIL